MATWDDGIWRELSITTRPGSTSATVKISGLRDSTVEMREISIPLDTLKEMVNEQ